MAGKLIVVVGGAFGSEGKGALCGFLASQESNLMAIRVAGPNAGHTVYGADGNRWQFRHVPVAAVTAPGSILALAAGSEIDLAVLKEETSALADAGLPHRLLIDGQATLISARHVTREQGIVTGTTGKGIGAARADRLLRGANLYDSSSAVNVAGIARRHLAEGGTVMIEGTQGYGLGLHAGNYPYCTSSDCRAVDFMAMAGLSPWDDVIQELEVWIVYRTHPIRIAGNSGPLKGETSWGELGVDPEITTVTKKVRRVGEWDAKLANDALIANGGPSASVKVALTFADYVFPRIAGNRDPGTATGDDFWDWVGDRSLDIGQSIDLIGTGPNSYIRGNA